MQQSTPNRFLSVLFSWPTCHSTACIRTREAIEGTSAATSNRAAVGLPGALAQSQLLSLPTPMASYREQFYKGHT